MIIFSFRSTINRSKHLKKRIDFFEIINSKLSKINYFEPNNTKTTISIKLFLTESISDFESMFEGCISMTSGITANSVKIGPDSYKRMFYGCINMSYIRQKFSATTSGVFNSTNANEFTNNWVYNVSSTGGFIYPLWKDFIGRRNPSILIFSLHSLIIITTRLIYKY